MRALLLEDEPALSRAIARHLRTRGFEVVTCSTVEDGKRLIAEGNIDAALIDLWLPDGSGLDVLSSASSSLQAIVMTGDATVDTAVSAIRVGVVDYLLKPFSMDALDTALNRLAARAAPVSSPPVEMRQARAESWRARYAPEMLGEHASLMHVFDELARIAATDCAILVHGETGTGKEVIARGIHAGSGRGGRAFVAVNCAAIPELLMESELFGHGRGAYTGATEKRIGRFQAADGGTLFLDEIGEMPLALQAKLLRTLQEKEVTPLGENKPIKVDVRVVAATHRDLDALVSEGRFREDLLYRLDVIRLELPPLRDRKGDIPALVTSLVQRVNERRGSRVSGVHPAAMDALVAYAWPGNVRQLQNAIERAALLRVEGPLMIDDLPGRVLPSAPQPAIPTPVGTPTLPLEGLDLREAVDTFEHSLIQQALQRTQGNRNRAAGLLRMSRTTLVEKLKRRGALDQTESDAGEDDEPVTGTVVPLRRR